MSLHVPAELSIFPSDNQSVRLPISSFEADGQFGTARLGFVCRTGTSYCTRHHLDRIWWEADFQVHILRWNKKDLSTAVSAGVVCEGAADLVKQVPGFHNSPGQSGADIFEHLSHGVVKLWPTDGMNPAT